MFLSRHSSRLFFFCYKILFPHRKQKISIQALFRCFYIETKWETKIALTFFTFLLLVFHSKIVRTAFHSLVLQYYAK